MAVSMEESRRCCQRLARRTGKNFYWSFLTLPRPMFRDMCVLYAFMRHTDDLGDDPRIDLADRKRRLADWRRHVHQALDPRELERDGEPEGAAAILPALADLAERRRLPTECLFDVIDGVESDLSPRSFESFADLERYCYQVAGAVGLCCVHIWGFDGDVRQTAIDCGTAFQLTNILRDLQEDARAGRVYLPTSDLVRFGVTSDDFLSGRMSQNLRQMMEFQVLRAREFYDRGRQLLPHLSRSGQRVHLAMLRIYGGLLNKIERRGYDVFTRRVELTLPHKLGIAAKCWLFPNGPG